MNEKAPGEACTCETTTYFTNVSKKEQNAGKVVKIVSDYVRSNPIRNIIVASSWGRTAVKLVRELDDILDDLNVVVVKLSKGCERVLSIEFDDDNRRFLEEKGIPILTSTHSLTVAVPWALQKRYKGLSSTELIADVLRLFCAGMNTCVEISLMAADAGLVKEGEAALVIGGTNGWADTVVTLKAATTPYFFKTCILKILAKPITGQVEDADQ